MDATITLIKSKIHRARVTDANLNYVGSITIDQTLISASGLFIGEKVQVVNVTTGARFETYVISGEPGSGKVCLNGAAARLVQPDDILIIIAYAQVNMAFAHSFKPKIVFVDTHNHITEVRESIHS